MKFFGYSNFLAELKGCIQSYSNIKYLGKFKTEDLPQIYNQIDVSYCVYKKGMNEEIAEPNKYYESLFFKKPIICQKNTLVASKVRKLNTGFILDISQENEITKFLSSLDAKKIRDKYNSISKLPKKYSYVTGEVFS
jgi:hypothetical protein